jgi:hypothetical protein
MTCPLQAQSRGCFTGDIKIYTVRVILLRIYTAYEANHCKGPISSLTVMGQTIITINDRALAVELLEKRSAITSGRPHTVFAIDMYVNHRLHAFS